MNNFKKNLVTNIALICILAFSVVHLLMLTLNLFNVTHFAPPYGFSYITAYILMIFSFALFVGGFFIENIKTLKIQTWFKILFYVAFFVFTNVYYILGLYQNIFFMLLFIAYITFLLNIIALSVQYNVNKDDKGKLKSSTYNLIFNTSTYSVALSFLALFVICIIKVILNSKVILLDFILEATAMLATCFIIEILYAVSHKKSKKLINACLIKIVPKTISPSAKK